MSKPEKFRVLIAGGGVAGLEAALALHDLASDAVQVTLLTPEAEFSYRPLAVREPFEPTTAPRWPLAELADIAHAQLVDGAFRWVDPADHVVHTRAGTALEYDALLLALGARRYSQLPYVITVNPGAMGTDLNTLVREVEDDVVRHVAFLVPSGKSWPLPLYELALMLSARARQAGADLAITLITPEPEPLALFGRNVSRALQALLEESGVTTLCGNPAQVHGPHWISVGASPNHIHADRLVALPELCGPSVPGIPTSASRGFVSVDPHSLVIGLQDVFAAGDMTANPVKHGGLAAQQADAAAQQIAVLAGARRTAEASPGIVRAMLLGPHQPLYIRAHMFGAAAGRSEASRTPLWKRPEKLDARYLGPALTASRMTDAVLPQLH